MSQVPACNSLHCGVLVPDNAQHCPPAAITLIVCILRCPYEHSLAFTVQLRSHFTFVNYFVVFGVTQRMGLILKGGEGVVVEWSQKRVWGGEGTSGNRTGGVSKIKQGSSVDRNRNAHPGKGILRLEEIFFSWSNQWNEFKNKFRSLTSAWWRSLFLCQRKQQQKWCVLPKSLRRNCELFADPPTAAVNCQKGGSQLSVVDEDEDDYSAKILSTFTLLCPEATSIIQEHIAELAALHDSSVSVDSSIFICRLCHFFYVPISHHSQFWFRSVFLSGLSQFPFNQSSFLSFLAPLLNSVHNEWMIPEVIFPSLDPINVI